MYVKGVFKSHTYTIPRPLLDDSPEVSRVIKGLGMPGPLPGF